jgi:hypothetical protein
LLPGCRAWRANGSTTASGLLQTKFRLKNHVQYGLGVLGLIAGCWACQGTGRQTDAPALRRQHYVYADSGRCDTTENWGVSVDVRYALLADTTAGSRAINDSLRGLVLNTVSGWLDSSTVAKHPTARTSFAEAARLIVTDYRAMHRRMWAVGGCWELNTRLDTVFANARLLTARLDTYTYTGGAHPNSYTTYISFDRRTGLPLTLNDMVSDTTTLLLAVERAFRQKQGLAPDQDLETEGYFLRDGQFFLPTSFGAGRTGLIFYYNPYEIAAYAQGPIELAIPYESLGELIRRNELGI